MTTLAVKRTLSRLPDLVVDLTIDRKRQLVRLAMLEFDSGLLAHFVLDILPREHGVVAAEDDSDIDEARLPRRPAYSLVVVLAGREHPARVLRLRDGDVTVTLGDPDAAYLARCEDAIAELLQAVDGRDIEAVVVGVDRYGRPEPDEGFLHLLHDLNDEARQDELHELCRSVGQKHEVSIIETRFVRPCIDLRHAIAKEHHFAWDAAGRRIVRRNWSDA